MRREELPLPATSNDQEFQRLVSGVLAEEEIEPEDVARLASHLAHSGQLMRWPDSMAAVDIASTGGPGSLSTLVAPLALVAGGHRVVKLGLPGRPAGAIDVLATVPGYRVRLTPEEIEDALARSGFAHFLADTRFAPLDIALYNYRRKTGAVAIPALAAASLLSKKLAVGISKVGLDVRVGGHGNFGSNYENARKNAQLFCRAAGILGIEAVAFLTNAEVPAQPWIGRGESLVALSVAAGLGIAADNDDWLLEHIEQCIEMARALDVNGGSQAGAEGVVGCTLSEALKAPSLQRILSDHLAAQGSSLDALAGRVRESLSSPLKPIVADASGFLKVKVATLRSVLVKYQVDTRSEFGDSLGVRLLVRPGGEVRKGDLMAEVRDELGREEIVAEVSSAFSVDCSTDQKPFGGRETVYA